MIEQVGARHDLTLILQGARGTIDYHVALLHNALALKLAVARQAGGSVDRPPMGNDRGLKTLDQVGLVALQFLSH